MGVFKTLRYFSSMRAGLVLLCFISIMAAIGSVVSPDSFYEMPLFKLLLILLLGNMTLCTGLLIIKILGRQKNLPKLKISGREAGLLLIHSGVILLLVGGMLNAYCGQSAEVSIIEDDTLNISSLIRTTEPLRLHLDRFTIDFNPDGSASQYKSLVVAQKESNHSRHTISVNHPLKVAGIKAYQQSFGYLIITRGDFGDSPIDNIYSLGAKIDIPGSSRQVWINDYVPNFNKPSTSSESLKPDNPKIIFSVYEKKKLIGVGAASFGQKLEVANGKYMTFSGLKPFTILRLKSDPGMPVTAAGGLLLVLGICVTQLCLPYRNFLRKVTENKSLTNPLNSREDHRL